MLICASDLWKADFGHLESGVAGGGGSGHLVHLGSAYEEWFPWLCRCLERALKDAGGYRLNFLIQILLWGGADGELKNPHVL